jgi:hypothetical protein
MPSMVPIGKRQRNASAMPFPEALAARAVSSVCLLEFQYCSAGKFFPPTATNVGVTTVRTPVAERERDFSLSRP